MKTERVMLDGIEVSERRRPIDARHVERLVASIKEIGLQTPITVLSRADGPDTRMILIAGAHRLEALRQLGEEVADCFVIPEDEDFAAIWEIDENFARAELTDAQRADHHRRREEILVRKGLVRAHGGDRKSSHQNGDLKSYADKAAGDLGVTPNTVRRDLRRAKKIAPAVLAEVAGTNMDKGVVLDELAGTPAEQQPERLAELRQAVIEAAARGVRGGSRPSRKNPDYKPNPAYDAAARLTGCCRDILSVTGGVGAEYINGGFLDEGMRARNLATIRAASEALALWLDTVDSNQAVRRVAPAESAGLIAGIQWVARRLPDVEEIATAIPAEQARLVDADALWTLSIDLQQLAEAWRSRLDTEEAYRQCEAGKAVPVGAPEPPPGTRPPDPEAIAEALADMPPEVPTSGPAKLHPDQLFRPDDAPSLDEARVRSLSHSLSGAGQLEPIKARYVDSGCAEIVDGAYRHAAAELLGWSEIDVEIVVDPAAALEPRRAAA